MRTERGGQTHEPGFHPGIFMQIHDASNLKSATETANSNEIFLTKFRVGGCKFNLKTRD